MENFSKYTENVIDEIIKTGIRKSLLLHVCCAPCSSYVLEYLSRYFNITVYFYNPNIDSQEEYTYRANEEARLIGEMPLINSVDLILADYSPEIFHQTIKGLESEREGGKRCVKCFELRLEETAKLARDKGFDFFTTTLSISPLKNSALLNAIGKKMSEKYNVNYLYSDFKKKNGYKRSVELSKEYNLYRQNYCGCSFSKKQAEDEGRA
ncbi:MAG: epoxyqueuosine reductase QueH [Ruminococcaceae bacterium]|nr:epoxyqueuosine reductase QueH [Oscillospiraceae bacterium]